MIKARETFSRNDFKPKIFKVRKNSDESDLEVIDEEFGEETKVSVLPIPSDLPKEERALMERAVQELMREASAFIKGRSAKKKINQGYELGANLNADGSIRNQQAFVTSTMQQQSVTIRKYSQKTMASIDFQVMTL